MSVTRDVESSKKKCSEAGPRVVDNGPGRENSSDKKSAHTRHNPPDLTQFGDKWIALGGQESRGIGLGMMINDSRQQLDEVMPDAEQEGCAADLTSNKTNLY